MTEPQKMLSTKMSFRKFERLKSDKIIEALFKTGLSVYTQNVKLVYLFLPEGSLKTAVQCTFTAGPKKKLSAPQRNLMKRRMREVYRKNKLILQTISQHKEQNIACMFIFSNQTPIILAELEKKMLYVLHKLKEKEACIK